MKNRILKTELIDWRTLEALQPDDAKVILNYADIQDSIKRYGFAQPFYVWENDGILYTIDGHTRRNVLESFDDVPDQLPATFIDARDRKEAIEILIEVYNQKHNPFNVDVLEAFIEAEEVEVDLNTVHIQIIEGEEVVQAEAKEDDYEIPDEIKTDIVLGDLFEIGPHRLLCGDSTDSDQVAKLMNGEKADMAHNDPPYGMKKEKDGVLNDNLNYEDLLQFNREWIAVQFMQLKENGSWYCWGIDEPLMDIYSEIIKPYTKEQKATFRNLIIWDKGNGQGQNSENTRSYAIADEKCLFVMCGVQGFNNNADNYFYKWDLIVNYLDEEKNKAKFTIKDCKRLAGHSENSGCHWFDKSQWMMPTKETYDSWRNYCLNNNIKAFLKEYEEIKKEYYSTRAYFNNTHDNFNNVWKFDRHKRQGYEGGHATPKPIPLCERAIKSSCPESGLVLDFFLGSGSTMVASHQIKRKCYGMELDPKYCQVIIDRMLKLDSSLKVKRNGIDVTDKYLNKTA